MRLLVQRVKSAKVTVEGEVVGSIAQGLLVLFGVHTQDSLDSIPYLVDKVRHLRIFSDSEGKMNLSLMDVGASVLVVSQFTLYGECHQGRRPSFVHSAKPDLAKPVYEAFVQTLQKSLQESPCCVATGRFGALMEVSLINDGPVTFLLDHPIHSN